MTSSESGQANDSACSFQVERINIDGLSTDSRRKLGVVLVQPEYELVLDGKVPFRVLETNRETQIKLIEKAFQIRGAESQDRNVPVPFILFPEAAIPVRDPDGLDCLSQQMAEAQGDVIFIGGLEGLSPKELRDLVNKFPPKVEVARPAFDAVGTFVNTCVIVIKPDGGDLAWHFQAKLAPSQWEQGRDMAKGTRLLYFVSRRLAFVCQICFDHIATDGTKALNLTLCDSLIECSQPLAAPLDFVFVPQWNPKPKDACVRRNTGLILNFQDPQLSNQLTTVVMVNKAAVDQESLGFGRSGFHYRDGRWQPPPSDIGPKGYELYESDDITSAVFRKRTQAIHVATWVPPSHNVGDPGNLRQPLENPRSYLITQECDPTPCSCLAHEQACGMFVTCDCLPCKLRETLLVNLPDCDAKGRWQTADEVQHKSLVEHYGEIRAQMLTLNSARTGDLLDLLLLKYEHRKANPDTWTEPRPSAVQELVAALSVLREWDQPLALETCGAWTAHLGDSLAVVVLDGLDYEVAWRTLILAYTKKFTDLYYEPEMRKRTVLFVALRSKGRIEPSLKAEWLDFTEPKNRAVLGDDRSITQPKRPQFWVCQGNFLEQAREEKSIKHYLRDAWQAK